MANLSQIANILNTELIPNLTGATPVTETLDNLTDLGKLTTNLSQNDLLDFKNKFVSAVSRTYFETRPYIKNGLGLNRTKEDFVGCVQRVKMELLQAENTDIYNLVPNKVYNAGLKWDGYSFSNRIFTEDVAFRIKHQIPLKDFISALNNVTSMVSFTSMIESTVSNTLALENYAMELTMLVTMIAKAKTREIKLVTMYNNTTGGNLTANTCLNDYEFLQWAKGIIDEVKSYVQDPNKKYNDGTITTFVPRDDIKTVFLNKFLTHVSTHLYSTTYNKEDVMYGVDTVVNSWCGVGDDLFPLLADVSKIDVTYAENGQSVAAQIDYVVGCIYDKDGLVWCDEDTTTTSDWNGDGAFSTIYENHLGKKLVDPRNTCVIFTLN